MSAFLCLAKSSSRAIVDSLTVEVSGVGRDGTLCHTLIPELIARFW